MAIAGKVLLPLAWVYGAVMQVRNWLFDLRLLPSVAYPVSVLGVGNLAVGGTGKTPHTEYLLRLFLQRFRTAVLSRGYGRRGKGFRLVDADTPAVLGGDEPCQMSRKFPQVIVAVCANRRAGMARLLALPSPPQVVVLDDNYQHRYVRAGLQILLTRYDRLYTADYVLPAGRLREGKHGARRADVVIVTNCPPKLSADEADDVSKRLHLQPCQHLFFTTVRYATPYLMDDPAQHLAEPPLDVLLVAGIAQPEPLRAHWTAAGCRVHLLRFPDHHSFSSADVHRMNEAFDALPVGRSIVVTTEKDVPRLRSVDSQLVSPLRHRLYVQPVEIKFLFGGSDVFDRQVMDYAASGSRGNKVK